MSITPRASQAGSSYKLVTHRTRGTYGKCGALHGSRFMLEVYGLECSPPSSMQTFDQTMSPPVGAQRRHIGRPSSEWDVRHARAWPHANVRPGGCPADPETANPQVGPYFAVPPCSRYSFSAACLSSKSAPEFRSASSVLRAPASSPVRAWATAR